MTDKRLTYAVLKLAQPDSIMRIVAHEFEDHDMPHDIEDDGTIVSLSDYGEVRFTPAPNQIRVDISSANFEHLYMLKEGIESHLTAFEPYLEAPIAWQGDVHRGKHPLHFRELSIVKQTRLSPLFIRLHCEGDLARYTKDGLHFRLALPPDGRAPVWPSVDENGKTIWPKGEDALHLPVYTFRQVDADQMSFDIYLHGNGQTCLWAEAAVGKPMGILGPGGGWAPDADQVLFIGDHTALPAIARMLEMRSNRTDRVILAAQSGDYPDLDDKDVSYVDDVLEALKGESDLPYVWFAGEKAQARAAKEWLKARGHSAKQMQVTAYWDKG